MNKRDPIEHLHRMQVVKFWKRLRAALGASSYKAMWKHERSKKITS